VAHLWARWIGRWRQGGGAGDGDGGGSRNTATPGSRRPRWWVHELAEAVAMRCARALELQWGGGAARCGQWGSEALLRQRLCTWLRKQTGTQVSAREQRRSSSAFNPPSRMLVRGQRPHDESDTRWPHSKAGRPLRQILKTYRIKNTT
jgi:hypothetical protein